MHDIVREAANFINLDIMNITYLFIVGFVGGLVSGFIGTGGAFVLTPGMMSLGVPGLVAVASNMCHKFPKALVGALKRAKYGQVDVKLGVILGVSAEAGVLYGAHIQQSIKKAFADAENFDLIVMGRKGRHGIEKALVGSITAGSSATARGMSSSFPRTPL